MRPCLPSIVLLSALLSPVANADPVTGHRDLSIEVPHHTSMLSGSLFYPADAADPSAAATLDLGGNPVFTGVPVSPDATAVGEDHPVVLLSHGLGGLVGNLDGFAGHCQAVEERSTHCRDIARAGVDLTSLDGSAWNDSYRDVRVQGVAAIDPALLHGLGADAAASLVDNVLLIGLGSGDNRLLATDFGVDGSDFATRTGSDPTTLVIPAASHHDALLTCTARGEAILADEGDDPVCTDVAGGDRSATHQRIIEAMADAFEL